MSKAPGQTKKPGALQEVTNADVTPKEYTNPVKVCALPADRWDMYLSRCPNCGRHDVIYLGRYLMWCRECYAKRGGD